MLLNSVRVAFCPLNSTESKLSKHLISFFCFGFIYQCTPTNMEETFIAGIMPRSAYVLALLPSLTCSSLNRETKATQKTEDNTLNITQWPPCMPVSHFTFSQCVSKQLLYSQHYPESCRINRAVPRAC